MTIGIYLLRFEGTSAVYIGQSLRIEERYTKHKCRLRNGLANYKLMEAYRLYGLPTLEILYSFEYSKDLDLDTLETETILAYRAVYEGLNINSRAGGGGTGLCGEAHGNSKYTNAQIINVFILLGMEMPFLDISTKTEVSIHTIRDISKGKTHRWLREKYPEDYEDMLDCIGIRSKNSAKDQGIMYPTILSPLGEEFTISNLSQFARDHGLNKSHLSGVLNKLRKSHLGWELR